MVKNASEYNELDTLRHSCAHVMAHAIKELFPDAKFGVGPPLENTFYYDVELEQRLTDEDLRAIEKKMAEIIKADHLFERKVLSRADALKFFGDAGETYKLDIINQIGEADDICAYAEGDFTDLCRGPHVKSTGQIKAFKLLSVAGAYWRGDERNPQMQRIYGTAFPSQKELNVYLRSVEEAKRRDHRKLGKELELYSFQEMAGPGLVFYHPKGGMLRYLIEQFIREEHLKRGYLFVNGPQILKSDVWKTSGHYDFYKENMFIYTDAEDKEYGIKPMNCPGHMLIYKTKMRSYRDLPLRFFEMGNVCRYEKSGVLHGLLRVRNFTQDDAHIFCLPEQLEHEIEKVLDFIFFVLKSFGFKDFEIDLSTRPLDSIGSDEMWEKATAALRGALEKKQLKYGVEPEGGAFYGPKIDVRIKDALGRSWQCSTIQCDFALPEKFKLEYVSPEGAAEIPIVLHRAILGSVERFMGTIVEHFAGAFPLWLAPLQTILLPISEKHEGYCRDLAERLSAEGLRVEVNAANDTLNKKIRNAQKEKIPYLIVVGDKEVETATVNARAYGSQKQTEYSEQDFVAKCLEEIKNKQASVEVEK
ncbi:MAG: threonine--tRNA ligase [Candidatus Omnitrophota bacterium]|nr:threonine--tRNA ligase [Candidatus Omnitrophota bacterium]